MPRGPVEWGERVSSDSPGVYMIETPEPFDAAPIDLAAVRGWLARVPTLQVDGSRPTPEQLAERLASYWIPREQVVYIGLASRSVANRVRQFYGTPLGDPGPHAGGHWLKTLSVLDRLRVWWAETDEFKHFEDALLVAFAERVPESRRSSGPLILPFANLETAARLRKPHGISGSRLRQPRTLRGTAVSGPTDPASRGRPPTIRADQAPSTRSNAALQDFACAHPDREVSANDAAQHLDDRGLLKDSPTRPGKPLRDLLRAGQIHHAYQRPGRWWFIRCGRRD